MLKTALSAILIAGFATSSMAMDGPKYDRKIEAAVKKIIAKKVGDIRGAYDAEAPLAVAGAEALGDADAKLVGVPLVQVAMLDVSTRPVFLAPSKYHSGRPEPVRKVRKATSFQYF